MAIRLCGFIFLFVASWNTNIFAAGNSSVSQELVRDIVQQEAQQVFGQTEIIDIETYYDVEGTPEVYCFTLYRNTDSPPSLNELKEDLKNSFEQKILLKKKLDETSNSSLKKQLKKQINLIGDEKIQRKSEFITVLAAAHEGHQPIIKMSAGLPPHLVFNDESMLLAKNQEAKHNLKLKRTIYLDMMTLGLEYEDPSLVNASINDDNVIVDPFRKKTTTLKKMRESNTLYQQQMMQRQKNDERKKIKDEKLKNKWDKVKRNYNLRVSNSSMVPLVKLPNNTSGTTKPSYREIIKNK